MFDPEENHMVIDELWPEEKEFEEEIEGTTEEELEEYEEGLGNFWDNWTPAQKKALARSVLRTYAELEAQYSNVRFSKKSKEEWRACL